VQGFISRLKKNNVMKTLSIIIPVYNEKETILVILKKIHFLNLINDIAKEIIIIDDGSTDGTRDILNSLDKDNYKISFHEKNSGKGMAIRTGLEKVTGDYVIIQDADLEYDPSDYNLMLKKMIEEDLPVLYGSRELKEQKNRYSGITFYWGGIILTKVANWFFGQELTDEPTCYKMFKTSLIKNLPLKCEGFEFCPEVTALVALRGIKIKEVGISYFPRDKSEGKKIKWSDGLVALWVFLKYRIKKIK